MLDTELVRWIQDTPGVTPAKAAERLGVSERTVREHVRQANDAMAGFARIGLRRGVGYFLAVDDPARLASWLRRGEMAKGAAGPSTPRQRVGYLLSDLLQRTDWITVEELARILYVSRITVSGDLKEVERTLHAYGLTLERRPHHGIRVSGPETARRSCMAGAVMAQGDDDTPRNAEGVRPLLTCLQSCLDEALAETGFKVNPVSYQNLLVHLVIAVMRIRGGCYVPMGAQDLAAIESSPAYPAARRIARGVEGATGTALPREEVAYIAVHLAGWQELDLAVPAGKPDGDTSPTGTASTAGAPVITDEVWGVVERMVSRVWEVYRFDLRNDIELAMNLAQHVIPLSVRLRYRLSVQNPLLAEIRTRFSLAYSMAAEACTVLTERYGVVPSEDETGYVALAFALALERRHGSLPKKTLLVVCASGAGSARLLAYRCRREFGDYVDKIITCDVADVARQDFRRIDYVFTTVPLPQPVPVPVRQVAHFLDEAEIAHAREFLRTNARGGRGDFAYFDRSLFLPHLALSTRDEVLDLLVSQAAKSHRVDPELADLVRERERLMPTAFGNLVAMPHPVEARGDESFVGLALLDEPVTWDERGDKVQAVFLLVPATDAGRDLQRFYSTLAGLVMDGKAVRTLLDDQRWETLEAVFADFAQRESI